MNQFFCAARAFIVGALSAIAILSCSSILHGCHSPPAPPPDGGSACSSACQRLADLGCEESKPTPAGVPCSVWLCETPSVNSACIVAAPSCSAVRDCR